MTIKHLWACALVALTLLASAALPAHAQSPAFRVDPYWPRPLPHNWILGQVGGISVDAPGQYLGVPAATLADRRQKSRRIRSAARQVLRAGAVGAGVQPSRRRREIVGRPRRQSRLRLAAAGTRHTLVDNKGFVWLSGDGKGDNMVLNSPPTANSSNRSARTGRLPPAPISASSARSPRSSSIGTPTKFTPPMVMATIASPCSTPTPAPSSACGARTANRRPTRRFPPTTPIPRNSPTRCIAWHSARTASSLFATVPTIACRCSTRTAVSCSNMCSIGDARAGLVVGPCFLAARPGSRIFSVLVDGSNEVLETVRRKDGAVMGHFGHAGRDAGEFHFVPRRQVRLARQSLYRRSRYRKAAAKMGAG